MGVSRKSRCVSDLQLRVLATAVHPDWFTVREHRRLVRTNWEADLRIIEGGHAVTWRFGGLRLTEMVCGSEAELPAAASLISAPFRRDKSATLRPGPNMEYQVNLGVERLTPELFGHLCDEFRIDATRGGLFYRQDASNRLAHAPLSFVRFDFVARGLSIQAFHTFPGECAIARTQSLFEIEE